jgi:hypothetical protein
MSRCPRCNMTLYSTEQTAEELGMSDSWVRKMLGQYPGQLRAARVGWGWIVPADTLRELRQQGDGVALPPDENLHPVLPTCPGCGERFLSPKHVAAALGLSLSSLYDILHRHPERLEAFRVGHRWYIPESAVDAYRTALQLLGGLRPGHGQEERDPTRIEVIVRQETCTCPAYPFPHRKGGGKCEEGPKRARSRSKRGPTPAASVRRKGAAKDELPARLRKTLLASDGPMAIIADVSGEASVVAKLPAADIAVCREAPADHRYELALYEEGPVLGLIVQILDEAESPLVIETLLDLNGPGDLRLAERLTRQSSLPVHLYGFNLAYHCSKGIPQDRHHRLELSRLIERGLVHLGTIERPDWRVARLRYFAGDLGKG